VEIGIKNDITLECLFSTDYVENAESELLYDGEKNRVRITIHAFSGRIYKEKSKLNKISL
jgi:hypothetical protein